MDKLSCQTAKTNRLKNRSFCHGTCKGDGIAKSQEKVNNLEPEDDKKGPPTLIGFFDVRFSANEVCNNWILDF